jgi:putative nucleotidyltransferase with HDIG domain
MVVRLNALLDDPDVCIEEIARAIRDDPSISAMVLRTVNSARYGLREPVRNIERAAMVLGIREIQKIVLQVAVVQQFDHLPSSPVFDMSELWKHSILTGLVAQDLARVARIPLPVAREDLYTCGLLHDIGKVILFDNFGEHYLEVMVESRNTGRSLWQCEVDSYNFSHPAIGGVVALQWALPAEVEAAIAHHHGPTDRIAPVGVVAITCLADVIANAVQAGETPPGDLMKDRRFRSLAGIKPDQLEQVIESAVESLAGIDV